MKVLLIIALAALAYSQDIIVTECWKGESINGVGNFTLVSCSFANTTHTLGESCQTKIESNQGMVKIDRDCKATDACENNAANNPSQCYSAEAIAKDVRVCFYCCKETQCNIFDDIIEVVEVV